MGILVFPVKHFLVIMHSLLDRIIYRVVQLNFITQEIVVFYMLFDRYISIFIITSLKQH